MIGAVSLLRGEPAQSLSERLCGGAPARRRRSLEKRGADEGGAISGADQ